MGHIPLNFEEYQDHAKYTFFIIYPFNSPTEVIVEHPNGIGAPPGGHRQKVDPDELRVVDLHEGQLPHVAALAHANPPVLPVDPERPQLGAAHDAVFSMLDDVGRLRAPDAYGGHRVEPAADDDLVVDAALGGAEVDVDVVAGADAEAQVVVLVVGRLPEVLVAVVVRGVED